MHQPAILTLHSLPVWHVWLDENSDRLSFPSVFVSGGVGQVFPGQFGKARPVGKSHPHSAADRPVTGRLARTATNGCCEPSLVLLLKKKKDGERSETVAFLSFVGFPLRSHTNWFPDLKFPSPAAPLSPLASHAPFHVMEMVFIRRSWGCLKDFFFRS